MTLGVRSSKGRTFGYNLRPSGKAAPPLYWRAGASFTRTQHGLKPQENAPVPKQQGNGPRGAMASSPVSATPVKH